MTKMTLKQTQEYLKNKGYSSADIRVNLFRLLDFERKKEAEEALLAASDTGKER